ncbi:MAG: DNA repair protein RecO [Parcubacteria group bacterium]|jgi:DNA repair protein RecO (recombination protein O)|nr:DNA repair protein RecO [Parcubacteria group bacterium]|tara:strand:- start:12690 stop:13250 length:561 start_codon:yes stop_codon:yes gene_type:complete
MTYQTQGIILKITDHREVDQLFYIYTLSQGKVVAIGRGTKKIKSKLNSNLKQLAVVDLMIADGKNYSHIAGATVNKNFNNIITDLKKIILASFALELVEKFTKVDQPDEKLFGLVVKYFDILNSNSFEEKDWQIIRQAFVIKLLAILGFAPTPEIMADHKKLDYFLKEQLDSELQTENFFAKMSKS